MNDDDDKLIIVPNGKSYTDSEIRLLTDFQEMYYESTIIRNDKKMELTSTYIETNNFEKSVKFYKTILQQEPNIFCENRWIEFECGNKIAIYNIQYDVEKIKENDNLENNYNKAYIESFENIENERKNNIITLNLYSKDLKTDYERIKNIPNVEKRIEIRAITENDDVSKYELGDILVINNLNTAYCRKHRKK